MPANDPYGYANLGEKERNIYRNIVNTKPELASNAINLEQMISQAQPFDMLKMIGRADMNEFGQVSQPMQEKYLQGLMQADSNLFQKLFADLLNQFNPKRSGALTREQMQSTLAPYFDIMRTGMPQK